MKKFILILAGITFSATFALAQGGYGYNDGATAYGGDVYVNDGYTTTYSGGTSCGYQSRVRWEYSPCGTYRYRCQERGYWVPGAYVYRNGCRRWRAGYYDWRPYRRTRVCINGRTGPRYRTSRGTVRTRSRGTVRSRGHVRTTRPRGGGYGYNHGGRR